MSELETYLKYLDESSYDHRDAEKINSEFQKVYTSLHEKGEVDNAMLTDLNRQVFAVQKSFDTKFDESEGTAYGLSWQMSGVQTLEDGRQIPVYWPNVLGFNENNYEYFEKRFKESKNLYIKTEYGLIVFFGQKTDFSKHNDFKRELFELLFKLAKSYFEKAEKGGEKNYYALDFFHTLRLAFGVAETSNLEPEFSKIVEYIFQIHQNWDITKENTLRILLDLSGLVTDYFNKTNKKIDFDLIVNKNWEGVKELEKSYLWGAMYAIDQNIAIERKRSRSLTDLLHYKAVLYEKLGEEARERKLAALNFVENALRIYQQLNRQEDIRRLETMYSELRGKFELSEFRQEMPEEHVRSMNENVRKAIDQNDEMGIILHFITTPWYDRIENIKKNSIELRKESVLASIMPTVILDKFGNTIDSFNTEEEKEKLSFWDSYSFNYQIGTQTMHMFFIESYKAHKLHYESVSSYLENTWYNEPISRDYHGQIVEVKPMDTLKSGIKKIFDELDKVFADDTYQYDFVMIIDSLTLKVEGLLRYFCEKVGIATFKTRQKGGDKLVMEKLLDDLLADIQHKPPLKPDQKTNFDENDRILIRYVMVEKAGLNLRNRVAHSLMDISEYSFEIVLALFCIILKLSKYKFTNIEGGDNNVTSNK